MNIDINAAQKGAKRRKQLQKDAKRRKKTQKDDAKRRKTAQKDAKRRKRGFRPTLDKILRQFLHYFLNIVFQNLILLF